MSKQNHTAPENHFAYKIFIFVGIVLLLLIGGSFGNAALNDFPAEGIIQKLLAFLGAGLGGIIISFICLAVGGSLISGAYYVYTDLKDKESKVSIPKILGLGISFVITMFLCQKASPFLPIQYPDWSIWLLGFYAGVVGGYWAGEFFKELSLDPFERTDPSFIALVWGSTIIGAPVLLLYGGILIRIVRDGSLVG